MYYKITWKNITKWFFDTFTFPIFPLFQFFIFLLHHFFLFLYLFFIAPPAWESQNGKYAEENAPIHCARLLLTLYLLFTSFGTTDIFMWIFAVFHLKIKIGSYAELIRKRHFPDFFWNFPEFLQSFSNVLSHFELLFLCFSIFRFFFCFLRIFLDRYFLFYLKSNIECWINIFATEIIYILYWRFFVCSWNCLIDIVFCWCSLFKDGGIV